MTVLWVRVQGPGPLPLDPKVWPADDTRARVAVRADQFDRRQLVGRFLAKTDAPAPGERRHLKHADVCPARRPDVDPPVPHPAVAAPVELEQLQLIPDTSTDPTSTYSTPGAFL